MVKLSSRLGALHTNDITRERIPAARSQASTNAQHPIRALETIFVLFVLSGYRLERSHNVRRRKLAGNNLKLVLTGTGWFEDRKVGGKRQLDGLASEIKGALPESGRDRGGCSTSLQLKRKEMEERKPGRSTSTIE